MWLCGNLACAIASWQLRRGRWTMSNPGRNGDTVGTRGDRNALSVHSKTPHSGTCIEFHDLSNNRNVTRPLTQRRSVSITNNRLSLSASIQYVSFDSTLFHSNSSTDHFFVCVFVCLCVCACERERERQRDRETERQRQSEGEFEILLSRVWKFRNYLCFETCSIRLN